MPGPRATAAYAVLSLIALLLAGLILAMASSGPAPKCSPDHIASLQGGLSYAQGYRAGLATAGADTTMADQNVAATQAALDACR